MKPMPHNSIPGRSIAAELALALLATTSLNLVFPDTVSAADHTNLEEGLPVTIEDAYAIKQNAIEAQGYFQYDRTRRDPEGKDRFWVVPRLEFGPLPNTQFTIEVPYRFGDASETQQGEFRSQLLYNFNTEGRVLPAFAVSGTVYQPFGYQSGGTETELKFLATKSLDTLDPSGSSPYSYVPRRLHFNASWFHNYDPLTGPNAERQDRYRVGVAYSQPLTNDLLLVTDVYRETDRARRSAINIAELGVRYQLTPQTILTGAGGVGFGGDRSQDFRFTFGFQRTLSTPADYPYLIRPTSMFGQP